MRNKGNITVWFGVGFLVLATVVVIIAAVASSGSLGGTPSSDTPAPAITEDEWTKGSRDAKVTIIEYADFQCPACASYHPLVNNIVESYGDQILFVYRHFPLYTIHPNAGPASQASEAAGAQGKFWEMYDLLYQRQNQWSSVASNRVAEDYFEAYAEELGLDMEKFRSDMNSDPVLRKIKRDADGGVSVGVGRTPTFYVNMQQIQSPASEEEFRSIIDAALSAS